MSRSAKVRWSRRAWPLLSVALSLPLVLLSCGQRAVKVELSGGHAVAEGYMAKWSPDSKSIAFITRREFQSSAPHHMPPERRGDLAVVSADGTGEPQVLTSRAMVWDFVWSPDSRKLLAGASRCYPDVESSDIRVIDALNGETKVILGPWSSWDTTSIRKFRSLRSGNIAVSRWAGRSERWWLIDQFGNRVSTDTSREKIFYQQRESESLFTTWMMNADGSDKVQFAEPSSPKIDLAWPSLARKVACYTQDHSGRFHIFIADEQSRSWRWLADSVAFPRWSPDGKWLVGQYTPFQRYLLISADGKYKQALDGCADFAPSGDRVLVWSFNSEHPFGDELPIVVYRFRVRG